MTYLRKCGNSFFFPSKEQVQQEFKKQIQVFIEADLDFLLCEYFEHVEEMEWAVEVCKRSGKPVAASMCIGPEGDLHGVSAAECAVRMVKAGANVGKFNIFIHITILKVQQGTKQMPIMKI